MTAEIITFPGVKRPTEVTEIIEALRPLRGEAAVVAIIRAARTITEQGIRPEELPANTDLRRFVELLTRCGT